MGWNIGASQSSGWDIGASQIQPVAPGGNVPTADLQGPLVGPLGGPLMFKMFIYSLVIKAHGGHK